MVAIRAEDAGAVADVLQTVLQFTDAGLTLHHVVLEFAQFPLFLDVRIAVQEGIVGHDHVVQQLHRFIDGGEAVFVVRQLGHVTARAEFLLEFSQVVRERHDLLFEHDRVDVFQLLEVVQLLVNGLVAVRDLVQGRFEHLDP
ncbi:hypothetical protein D3C73_1019020 [compost metagenome]